ncbi:hypothetical protein [Streptomyces alanosinicus]|uniref:hypothetical protein n=1 Tax=Streptomyces alanosinicus TaxID=68171 RepID=UPI003570E6C1
MCQASPYEPKLAAARPARLYAYLGLSLLSGVRTEEARPLAWDHVFLETTDGIPPHVAVWRSVRKHGETKTRKSRRTRQLRPVITQGAEAMDDIFAADQEEEDTEGGEEGDAVA